MNPSSQNIEHFGATLAALDAEINWDLVATVYCEGDAEGFFDEERRAAVLDAGLKLASDLGEALPSGGRSLYVGAAVAELAPMLFEAIVLGRRVVWKALPSAEMEELTRALRAVAVEGRSALPEPKTETWLGRELGRCDHVWMTSVLTDPDAFPALHDALYQRQGTPEAVGGGHPREERRRARELVDEALVASGDGAVITTSEEELAVWEAAAEEFGLALEVAPTGRMSGVVGDVIRRGKLRRRA
ncbi:MAG: hypothetical protein P8R46_12825 [Planctomycetota bacterium]|nr:hypothetical protein [Planctomycetota bacterium]